MELSISTVQHPRPLLNLAMPPILPRGLHPGPALDISSQTCPPQITLAGPRQWTGRPQFRRHKKQPQLLFLNRRSADTTATGAPRPITLRRSFLTSLTSTLSSALPPPQPRTLTASRILPYPARPLFATVAAVESYARFLPFVTASVVTERDLATGYPRTAYLTAGYGPFAGTFTSRVECDRDRGRVVAASGERLEKEVLTRGRGKKDGDDNQTEGLFRYLDTVWQLTPVEGGADGPRTKIDLRVSFQVVSAVHATVMSAVDGQVASMMIEAFERRMKELHG